MNTEEEKIIEELALFSDWMSKYEYIIELGNELMPMDEKLKNDDHLIRDCQSKVWLHSHAMRGYVYYIADSDSLITKGFIAIFVKIYSGLSVEEIINTDPEVLERTGLMQHLSPSRSNGVRALLNKIKQDARKLHQEKTSVQWSL